MIIELRNEETGNVKKISHGINWFLLITAPIFGITLLKNKLNRSGFIMLITSALFVLGIICFSVFSSSYASLYPYAGEQVQPSASFVMQIYYLLDIDYEDVLEFFLVSSACLILFISCFSCFTAYNANKWIAENYRYAGYKVIAPNTLVRSLLKKDWGLTDDDFIEESK